MNDDPWARIKRLSEGDNVDKMKLLSTEISQLMSERGLGKDELNHVLMSVILGFALDNNMHVFFLKNIFEDYLCLYSTTIKDHRIPS